MKRRFTVTVALFMAACGSDGTTPAPEPLVVANGTHLLLTLQKAPSSIVTGGSAQVLVAVARDGKDAFDGDVSITIGAAAGVSATPVTIARTASSAMLSVSVAADHKHGDVAL